VNIARAVGSVVATVRADELDRPKFLLVELCGPDAAGIGKHLVAVDPLGAGPGEIVLVSQGSSARQTDSTKQKAVDAVVVAIVDIMEEAGKVTYHK
jgi:carbon dioxide concentrating mechanism protein CcmL